MHFNDFNFHSMAIRHLVAVYAIVLLVQGGYFAWVAAAWLKLDASAKKARKPVE